MVLDTVHEQAFAGALERAQSHGLEVHPQREIRRGDDVAQVYEVASFSQRGTFHVVRLTWTSRGIDFNCSCKGAEFGHLCQHVAAALAANGISPMDVTPSPVAGLGKDWLNDRLGAR